MQPRNKDTVTVTYLTHKLEDKRVHPFSKGISLKVNVIVPLASYKVAVHHVTHYAMELPQQLLDNYVLSFLFVCPVMRELRFRHYGWRSIIDPDPDLYDFANDACNIFIS